jgi:flavorubredoxin
MASVDEIAPDIFRISLGAMPGDPITTSFFLIRDEQPTLVETGYRKTFDDAWEAVSRLLDPTTLRYVVVPHLEGDESGALNHFLERAPNAKPVGSPIGAAVNLSDFAIREPLVVDDSDAFDLGSHRLRFLVTPYVHQWDSMLAYDETTRTVFCSDVFISLGEGPAVTDRDESDAMLDAYRMIGIFPSKPHLDSALDKIEAAEPATLACHHGSVKGGRGVQGYLRAMRENDVTGLTEWNPMAEVG